MKSIIFAAALSMATCTLASVECATIGATATATWVNAAEETCTFVGIVGSNYGDTTYDGTTGVDYSCNGRCGAGCDGTALGDYYTQDCFSHDICSYFNDASGGASDENCGADYKAAEDDFLLGGADGCSQTNPTSAVSKPTATPVCT